jgi:hypothetical protein
MSNGYLTVPVGFAAGIEPPEQANIWAADSIWRLWIRGYNN